MFMQIFEKMKDMVFILLVTGFFSWIANIININPPLASSAVGVFVLVVLASIGIFLSMVPVLNKLPMVFWVSIVAVAVSVPGFPGGEFVMQHTNNVSFLALTTPLLAYAGLSIGKDMETFKKQGFAIICVALCTFFGTYIGSAVIAQLVLKLTGVI